MSEFSRRYPPPRRSHFADQASYDAAKEQWRDDVLIHTNDCLDDVKTKVTDIQKRMDEKDAAALSETAARVEAAAVKKATRDERLRQQDEDATRRKRFWARIRAGYQLSKELMNSGFILSGAIAIGIVLAKFLPF